MNLDLQKIWNDSLKNLKERELESKVAIEKYIENCFYAREVKEGKLILSSDMDAMQFFINPYKLQLIEIWNEISPIKVDDFIYLNLEEDVLSRFPEVVDSQDQVDISSALITSFNPDYTFEEFVYGDNSKNAYRAARSVVENHRLMNSYLLIYGNSGLGKTHLLQAIAQEIQDRFPHQKVLYVDTNSLIDLLLVNSKSERNRNRINEIKAQLQNTDYLILDDIQYLNRWSKSQEIIFGVINPLANRGKKIILACDVHPNNMSGVEARLTSRFASGLTFEIKQPSASDALTILRNKLRLFSVSEDEFTEEALIYLAEKHRGDIRGLEGSIKSIMFQSTCSGKKKIDLDFIKSEMEPSSYTLSTKPKKLDSKTIKEAVADFYNIPVESLDSNSRIKNITTPRKIAIYICRFELKMPLTRIAAEFNRKDHTTIRSSLKKLEKELDSDLNLKKVIDEIMATLR